jgi:hypothetical protein
MISFSMSAPDKYCLAVDDGEDRLGDAQRAAPPGPVAGHARPRIADCADRMLAECGRPHCHGLRKPVKLGHAATAPEHGCISAARIAIRHR